MTKDKFKLVDYFNHIEGAVDKQEEEIVVIPLGSQLVKVVLGKMFVEGKITMSYGAKQKVKSLNKADSILYDEDGDNKIEMKLKKNNDVDIFILSEQLVNSDLGKLTRKDIDNNETHLDLFDAFTEIVKIKNGLQMTKKQLEKKKKKKK